MLPLQAQLSEDTCCTAKVSQRCAESRKWRAEATGMGTGGDTTHPPDLGMKIGI